MASPTGLLGWLTDSIGLTNTAGAHQLQENSNAFQKQSQNYGNQAGGIYQGLSGTGQQQLNYYDSILSSLLPQLATLGGFSLGNSAAGGGTAGGSVRNPQESYTNSQEGFNARGGTYGSNVLTGLQGGATASDKLNGLAGGGSTAGSTPASSDPYALSQYEQQQLNQGLDAIAQQKQMALSSYQAALGARGIYDPAASAAGQEQINLHFGGLADSHTADFMEAQRQNRQNALQWALQFARGGQDTGLQALSGAGGGLTNLAAGQQAASGQAFNQSQQITAQNNATLGTLLQLAAYLGSGGLGGGGSASKTGGVNASGLNFANYLDGATTANPTGGIDAGGLSLTPDQLQGLA